MINLKNKLKILLFFVFSASFFFASTDVLAKPKRKQAFDRGLIVYAPNSLTNALHQILKEFSISENISVSSLFDSSLALEEKVEDGLPVNIFITENNLIMKDLQQKGLINVYSISQIASDRLVIVAPKTHYLLSKIKKFDNLKDKLKFISEKSLLVVPDINDEFAGVQAKKIFEAQDTWDRMKKSLIKAANTRDALFLAAKGNNLAVVYQSDAVTEKNLEIVLKLPEIFNDRIIYQAVIVADITNQNSNEDANKFVEFLKSKKARKIFAENGFKGV